MRTTSLLLPALLSLLPAVAFAAPAAPPPYLSPEGQTAFAAYLASPVGKAFAAEPMGGFAWVSGQDSSLAARDRALSACQQSNPGKACVVVSIDGEEAR
jgi:hypothetical protein